MLHPQSSSWLATFGGISELREACNGLSRGACLHEWVEKAVW